MKQEVFKGDVGFTTEKTRYEYDFRDKTPENAPNVVYIVLDDMGYAQLGCFGSDIHTPNIDRLAEEGLRYNNFHTTAICSATRCSLLTGMNHHTAGISSVVEENTGCRNTLGGISPDCATLAEILKEYDYGTFAVGKWHLAAMPQTTEAGPFHNWPLGKGFDKYYGFLHAQMDQFSPRLTKDNSMIDVPHTDKEYHFSEDLVDQAIKYIFHQKEVYPNKPFFAYLAFGAMHAPHHAPKEYIDKYRGKFDEGWDVLRERWFERQKQLGVVPENASLTPRNQFVEAWEDLTEKQKKVYARFMEAFAGMLEHTDAQIGRFLDYLKKIGELDNTIIVFLSDNGASGEGGTHGAFNNQGQFGRIKNFTETEENFASKYETIDYLYDHIDEIGRPGSFNHYPIGWANLGNTPFPWYKTWVYTGGIKDAMIIRYPKLIKDPGAVRSQYHHVSDITPTILDIIGIEKPKTIKGVPQLPFSGISMKYSMEDGDAPDKRHVQYYEMLGNRAIYRDGWKAITNHQLHFEQDIEEDTWELYHVAEDYSECHNVADQYPGLVKELERQWFIEAGKAGVFPLKKTVYASPGKDNRIRYEEFSDEYENIVEPFDLVRVTGAYYVGLTHSVIAHIHRDNMEQGVIFSSGNYHGGISFYIYNNHLKFVANFASKEFTVAESDFELPRGDIQVAYRYLVTEDRGIHVMLYINGEKVAKTAFQEINTAGFVSTVGANRHSSVYPSDYEVPFAFEGRLDKVGIYVDKFLAEEHSELKDFISAD